MQETWVLFLGQENPLEREMATHSNILAWRIPGTEDPGRSKSMGSQESDMASQLNHHHQQTFSSNHCSFYMHCWVQRALHISGCCYYNILIGNHVNFLS